VINLLEALFPTSIDILKKERSNIEGIKPILILESDENFLFSFLLGMSDDSSKGLLSNVPLEFGCNQAILVKDEESKQKVK